MSVLIRPNATWSQWSASGPTGGYISIQWTEAPLARTTFTFPLTFYIGILGFDSAASFGLVFSTNAYIQLVDGVPQTATVRGGVLSYFLIDIPPITPNNETVGMTVTAVPLSGGAAVNLFLNTVNVTVPQCTHCGYPWCTTMPCDPNKIASFNHWWSSEDYPSHPMTVRRSKNSNIMISVEPCAAGVCRPSRSVVCCWDALCYSCAGCN